MPTERPPHVGEVVPTFADRGCCVVSLTDPPIVSLGFLDRSRYYFFQVAPQLSSRGWVDPVPDPNDGVSIKGKWSWMVSMYGSGIAPSWLRSVYCLGIDPETLNKTTKPLRTPGNLIDILSEMSKIRSKSSNYITNVGSWRRVNTMFFIKETLN
jgi:hypothetical protein